MRKEKQSKTSHQLDTVTKIVLYKKMLFYRRFEERVNTAYTKQQFSGFCHLHIGQEAVCAGVEYSLRPEDYMISGYRSHTQAISKGISAEAVFAELLGRSTGCSAGKGGSMHMFSKECGFLGGHGIVGGQAPLAVGAAFALKYNESKGNVVCFLGDAAMNQGQVFEAMNMAEVWDLPVLFVIENNHYGMGTDIRRTTAVTNLAQRALGVGMKHSTLEAMDVRVVAPHIASLMQEMRETRKPHLVELMTYRYKGHSVSDPGTYRTREEVESYQKLDPITQLGDALLAEGAASKEDLQQWDAEARAAVAEAHQAAERGPVPEIEEAYTHVFSSSH